jgi:hypothetical protein
MELVKRVYKNKADSCRLMANSYFVMRIRSREVKGINVREKTSTIPYFKL